MCPPCQVWGSPQPSSPGPKAVSESPSLPDRQMKWHEVCLSISAAILEILNAWENGVLTFESIQVGLVGCRVELCCVLRSSQGFRNSGVPCSPALITLAAALELAVTWKWETDVAPALCSCSKVPCGCQGQCHPWMREWLGPTVGTHSPRS